VSEAAPQAPSRLVEASRAASFSTARSSMGTSLLDILLHHLAPYEGLRGERSDYGAGHRTS